MVCTTLVLILCYVQMLVLWAKQCLNALQMLPHLILITALWNRYFNPHFTDEETGPRNDKNNLLRFMELVRVKLGFDFKNWTPESILTTKQCYKDSINIL